MLSCRVVLLVVASAAVEAVTIGGSLTGHFTAAPVHNTRFAHPRVICADPINSNGWWIGDSGSVRYCDGKSVTLTAGDQNPGFASGFGADARFDDIQGLVCNRDRTQLFVSDSRNHRLRTIKLASGQVLIVAGNGKSKSVDGVGKAASLHYPGCLVFERSPRHESTDSILWLVSNDSLRRFDTVSGAVTTQTLHQVRISRAETSIGCTSNGVLILIILNKLYSFDPRADVLLKVAGGTGYPGFKDGSGGAARFHRPFGVAVADRERCVFVADTFNHRIRRVTLPSHLFQ